MSDKTALGISDELRQYIEAMVEEVVLEGKFFENHKKYLQRFCEVEGVDYACLENNLMLFFEVAEEWKNYQSKSSQIAMRTLAKECYLLENTVDELMRRNTVNTFLKSLVTEFVDPQLLIRNGKIDVVEKDGCLITPSGWEYVHGFHEGLAVVEIENGLQGYIDTMGNIVIPCKWRVATNFSEGFAVVGEDYHSFFFIDKLGNIIITCGDDFNPYQNCGGFHEGLAVVENKQNGKYGFIDKSGRVAIPCTWNDASWFEDGLASVQDDQEKFGCINKEGKLVIPCRFEEGIDFHEGLAIMYSEEDYFFVIDKNGRKVFDVEYDVSDTCFQEGLASCLDQGFIDMNGDMVIEGKSSPQWMGFSEGLAPTEEGYIDHSGKVVITADWEDWSEFKDGLAQVCKDGKWGYIDHSGHIVIPCIWDDTFAFSEGLAKVKNNDKYFFINKQGKVLCKVKKHI